MEAAWPVGARVNTNWVFSGAKEARWEEVEEVEEVEDCEEGEDLAGCTSIRGTWGGGVKGQHEDRRIGGQCWKGSRIQCTVVGLKIKE